MAVGRLKKVFEFASIVLPANLALIASFKASAQAIHYLGKSLLYQVQTSPYPPLPSSLFQARDKRFHGAKVTRQLIYCRRTTEITIIRVHPWIVTLWRHSSDAVYSGFVITMRMHNTPMRT